MEICENITILNLDIIAWCVRCLKRKLQIPGSIWEAWRSLCCLLTNCFLHTFCQATLQDLRRPSSAFSLLVIDLFLFSDISLLQPDSRMSWFCCALLTCPSISIFEEVYLDTTSFCSTPFQPWRPYRLRLPQLRERETRHHVSRYLCLHILCQFQKIISPHSPQFTSQKWILTRTSLIRTGLEAAPTPIILLQNRLSRLERSLQYLLSKLHV